MLPLQNQNQPSFSRAHANFTLKQPSGTVLVALHVNIRRGLKCPQAVFPGVASSILFSFICPWDTKFTNSRQRQNFPCEIHSASGSPRMLRHKRTHQQNCWLRKKPFSSYKIKRNPTFEAVGRLKPPAFQPPDFRSRLTELQTLSTQGTCRFDWGQTWELICSSLPGRRSSQKRALHVERRTRGGSPLCPARWMTEPTFGSLWFPDALRLAHGSWPICKKKIQAQCWGWRGCVTWRYNFCQGTWCHLNVNPAEAAGRLRASISWRCQASGTCSFVGTDCQTSYHCVFSAICQKTDKSQEWRATYVLIKHVFNLASSAALAPY